MIKIQLYKDIEPEFFDGRDFGGSIDIVKDVLSDVKKRGDEALSEYGAKIVRLDAFAYAPKEPGKKNFLNEPDTWDVLEKVKNTL